MKKGIQVKVEISNNRSNLFWSSENPEKSISQKPTTQRILLKAFTNFSIELMSSYAWLIFSINLSRRIVNFVALFSWSF